MIYTHTQLRNEAKSNAKVNCRSLYRSLAGRVFVKTHHVGAT